LVIIQWSSNIFSTDMLLPHINLTHLHLISTKTSKALHIQKSHCVIVFFSSSFYWINKIILCLLSVYNSNPPSKLLIQTRIVPPPVTSIKKNNWCVTQCYR
jgi:hypothetical protein